MATKRFYGTELGSRLVDDSHYPPAIRSYLRAEALLIQQASHGVKTLVEIGCMEGRLMHWALARDMRYFGVDVEPLYATVWGDAPPRATFVLGDAQELASCLGPFLDEIVSQEALLIFPFNSIGNVDRVVDVARSLTALTLPFLAFSYRTTPEANSVRRCYYERCRYHDLEMSESDEGVRFTSSDGLDSRAYHLAHLKRVFEDAGISVVSHAFGVVGLAFFSSDVIDRIITS